MNTPSPPTNPLDNIKVVLVQPATPGNIGATARVLKTTGISRLVLVNPGEWDTPEARWTAHGSGEILDSCQVCEDLPEAVSDAHIVIGTTHRLGRFRDVCTQPRDVIAAIAPEAHHHQIALVFGREKDGLWRRELQHCHQLLRFPAAAEYPSFNLSHAVLLFAYEFYHVLNDSTPPPPRTLATATETELLYQHIGRSMAAIDFISYNDDPSNFARVLRRFFGRAPLERRDAMVIHKICGAIRKFAARQGSATPPTRQD